MTEETEPCGDPVVVTRRLRAARLRIDGFFWGLLTGAAVTALVFSHQFDGHFAYWAEEREQARDRWAERSQRLLDDSRRHCETLLEASRSLHPSP